MNRLTNVVSCALPRPVVFRFVLAVLVLCLGACAGILNPGPPVTQLLLPVAVPQVEQAKKTLPVQLLVSRPLAPTSTNLDRILAVMNGHELKALDSARWAEPIPVVLLRQIVEVLYTSGLFRSVTREESTQDSDVRLETEITRFHLYYEAPDKMPTVRVGCRFSLVEMGTGKLLGKSHFERTTPCEQNSVDAFVRAFSTAWSGILADVRGWAATALTGYSVPKNPVL